LKPCADWDIKKGERIVGRKWREEKKRQKKKKKKKYIKSRNRRRIPRGDKINESCGGRGRRMSRTNRSRLIRNIRRIQENEKD
jgi:hypothetical protein